MALNEIAKQIVDIFQKDKSYFENREWTAFMDKYNVENLCFKDKWNFRVSNLVDKDLTDNLYVNLKPLIPFYEWLGERIALSLNSVKGKTNEELRELLNK